MVMVSYSLREDYWETFELQGEDLEFLYNYLLELETPMPTEDLVDALVQERIRQEIISIEQQRSAGGDIYLPKERYEIEQSLVFPALGWRCGKVVAVRPGFNPDMGEFEVINVDLEDGENREFAMGLEDHLLNQPPEVTEQDDSLNHQLVMEKYQDKLVNILRQNLEEQTDFVRIAWSWFPRALLVDVNVGHLNLAEAVLDMAGGGPLPTTDLLEQVELSSNVNPKLLEFSMDLALQEDARFDEVGPAGEVLWYLRRLEPAQVLETPLYLRSIDVDYDRSVLDEQMLALEQDLDDELSQDLPSDPRAKEVEVSLIYPHWRAGTLPLSSRLLNLFPTAYEAPLIRFTLVDGDSGDKFPAWVVRERHYVYGLAEWYEKSKLIPGSVIRVKRGETPGEVIIYSDSQRTTREWVRTVLVGSDGGLVFAMLKQIVPANFDDRMVIAVPDPAAIDQVWTKMVKERPPFERVVVNTVLELAKLNPQSHVHVSELYAAVNIVRRCPPGPIMSLLASRPWFAHVGDLHYRYIESE